MGKVLEKIREYANRRPNNLYIGYAVGAFIALESAAFYGYILRPYFLDDKQSVVVLFITGAVHFRVLFPLFRKLFGWPKGTLF